MDSSDKLVEAFQEAVRAYGNQSELARLSGVRQTTISNWLNRGSIPALDAANRVAAVIGFSRKLGS